MEENVYGAKEAAALLSVKESTIRKYALLLEEAGYHFDKDPTRGRAFYDKDVIAIRRMMEGSKGSDMTLKRAAHAVVTAMADTGKAPAVMDDITPDSRYIERYIEEMTDLKEVINNQNELIRGLMERLEEESAARKEMERKLLNRIEEGPKEQPVIVTPDSLKETEKRILDRLDKLERDQEEEINLFEEEPAVKTSLWKRLFK